MCFFIQNYFYITDIYYKVLQEYMLSSKIKSSKKAAASSLVITLVLMKHVIYLKWSTECRSGLKYLNKPVLVAFLNHSITMEHPGGQAKDKANKKHTEMLMPALLNG